MYKLLHCVLYEKACLGEQHTRYMDMRTSVSHVDRNVHVDAHSWSAWYPPPRAMLRVFDATRSCRAKSSEIHAFMLKHNVFIDFGISVTQLINIQTHETTMNINYHRLTIDYSLAPPARPDQPTHQTVPDPCRLNQPEHPAMRLPSDLTCRFIVSSVRS